MSWTTFNAAVIKTRFSAREAQVYQQTAAKEYPEEGGGEAEVPDGQDPDARINAIAAQVLARFRGAILANPRLTYIGAEGTLPEFCHESAAIIGRVGVLGLNPVPEGMTDPRVKEYQDALAFLKSLSSMSPAVFLETPVPSETPSTTCPDYGGECRLQF
jgi:hypothetical protein